MSFGELDDLPGPAHTAGKIALVKRQRAKELIKEANQLLTDAANLEALARAYTPPKGER